MLFSLKHYVGKLSILRTSGLIQGLKITFEKGDTVVKCPKTKAKICPTSYQNAHAAI